MDDAPAIAGLAIGDVVGRGGFATVWAAGPDLVVKLAHRATEVARDRADREAAALVRLAGLHAPRLVGRGELDGRPYLVLERVHVTEQAELRAVAAALAAIHGRGVVHGDLKPANLAAEGFVDFGSASVDAAPALPGASAAYTAPELWRGGGVTAASDVYALGAIVYARVAGAPPFTGEARDVRHGHLMLRPAFAGIDAALAPILARCLAKDPAVRPSAAEVAAELARWEPRGAVTSRERARQDARTCAIAVADVRIPAPTIARWLERHGGALLHVRGERVIAAWPAHDAARAVAAARELHDRHGGRAWVAIERIACDAETGELEPGHALIAEPPVPARWTGVIGTARVAAALRLRAGGDLVDLVAEAAIDDAPLVGRDRELGRAIACARDGRAVAIVGAPGLGRSHLARHLAARLDARLISARDGDRVPEAARVVVDDLDAASDELIAALAGVPWFAVAGASTGRASRLLDRIPHEVIELAPLDAAASAELVERTLGVERIAEDVVRRLVAITGGRPPAILELAAHLQRAGAVRDRPGVDRRYLAADAVTLPDDAGEDWLAEAALAALPAELRALAAVIAWLEPGFAFAELEAVAGDGSADPALGLVALATRGIANGHALASPALVRAARRLIGDPRPVATAALAVLGTCASATAELAADARTRRAIASYARILGDRSRAATLLLGLADDARRAHHDADAEADYSMVIAELGATGSRELRALALLGRGIVRYRLDRAADAVVDLEAAAADATDAATATRARLEAATALDWLGRYADSARMVELAGDGDTADLACARAMANGRSALRAGRPHDAVTWLAAAADAAPRVDTDDHRVVALLLLGPALVHAGDLAAAERRFAEALALADRLGDPLARCATLGNRQLLWSALGDHPRARQDLVAARELARRLGHAVPERNTTYNLAEYLYWAGELDEAERLATISRDLQQRLVGRAVEDEVLVARIAAVSGDDAAARAALARAGATAELPPSIRCLADAVVAWLSRELFSPPADLVGEELVEVLAWRYAAARARGHDTEADAAAARGRAVSTLQTWRFRGSGLQAGHRS